MIFRGAILVAIAVLGGCAHTPAPRAAEKLALDEVFAFSDATRCEPAPAHALLLQEMVAGDVDVGFRSGRIVAPKPLARAFGAIFVEPHDNYTVVGVPVSGTLFGLPLASIRHSLPEGGDPGDVSYTFDTPVTVLERVLRARGFPAEAGRAITMGPPDGYEHVIELGPDPRHPGRAIVSCGYK